MANAKHLKWLYEQLPQWVEQGLLTPEQADQLRAHYQGDSLKPDYNLTFLTIGILGALLMGGGIILILAYNWEDISKTVRTVLSFMPVVLGLGIFGHAYLRRSNSIAWVEGGSAFLMLMLAASIALLSQTYHIWGESETFLWNWMLLSLPLLYLMNSSLCAVIYLIGITLLTLQTNGSDSVWYWALLGAVLPHFYWNWRKTNEPIRRSLLGWALICTFTLGWFGTIETDIPEMLLIGTALNISLFYALHQLLFYNETNPFRAPLKISVWLGFIFIITLTYNWGAPSPFNAKQLVFGKNYSQSAGMINFAILLAIATSWLWASQRLIRLGQRRSDLLVLLLPLFAFSYLLLARSVPEGSAIPVLFANLWLLGWGIARLRAGLQSRHMAQVNQGMFFLLALITARFFDAKWDFIIKGIAFILLGLGFLGVNWYLAKKLKVQSLD